MSDPILARRLRSVARRRELLLAALRLSAVWLAGALAAGVALGIARLTGWSSPLTMPVLAALAGGVSCLVIARGLTAPVDEARLAERIERRFPDLRGLLLTAVQQARRPAAERGFLDSRVIDEAVARGLEQDWRRAVPAARLVGAQAANVLLLAIFGLTLFALREVPPPPGSRATINRVDTGDMRIDPGDVELEKGETLVVVVTFPRGAPSAASLEIETPNEAPRVQSLVRSLGDPVFGGTVPAVETGFTYRVVADERRSADFRVRVFERPRLERSDLTLRHPEYTGLGTRELADTQRLSAVEGTVYDVTLQLNKPVTSARLVGRDEAKTVIPLAVAADRAQATLTGFRPEKGGLFDLELTDAEGRAGVRASPFVIDVQPNRRPELRLAAPRGDVRPSALEEVRFSASVADDFGVVRYGLAYAHGEAELREVELGADTRARERRAFSHLLPLEELGARPDELVTWHLWADDIGPDGTPRRTRSDLYFAEVRPFDEIFRENTGMSGGAEQEREGGQQGGAQRLAELQKQIVSATWRLQRDPAATRFREDVTVVRDSQVEALTQARAAAEAAGGRSQALWGEVTRAMETAASRLDEAAGQPARLAAALAAEQAALQGLLRLQERENQVTRSRSRNSGQGEGQANSRQMEQLDLAQAENRYETRRDPRAARDPERREQLQVMNRLQELARRQQDVNERLRELEAALREARSEPEREEARRELRRLQEEQREMLAGVDELRQRMDRSADLSRNAEQRQQLERTREDLQRAAEATGEGSVSQALASGTRAQRQLQDMRDTLRAENAGELADDLRELRGEAREAARAQQQVAERLEALTSNPRRSLGEDPARAAAQQEIEAQRKRVEELMEKATRLSEQAETAEPLVSRGLYDSLRKATQDDAAGAKGIRQELLESGRMSRALYQRLQNPQAGDGARSLEATGELLREGLLPQAVAGERQARRTVEELRKGVERAAERVLGDDAEALRLAQAELGALTDELEREAGRPGGPGPEGDSGERPGESPGERAAASAEGTAAAAASGTRAEERREKSTTADRPGEGGRPAEDAARTAGAEERENGTAARPGPGGGGSRSERAGDERRVGRGGAAGDVAGIDLDSLLEEVAEAREGGGGPGGPITGGGFGGWSERLREIEEVVDEPELRRAIAGARERARQFRQEYRRNLTKPDWAVVRAEIVRPLVEVRTRIAEDLARRESPDALAPVDRDPVPARFAEGVRRYYEELGKEP